MPMIFYPEYFPPDPPPRKPTAAELSSRLLDAVIAKDIGAARQIFETAFWEKIELKPDGYHLLQAALRGDRQMVTLLTSYDATWSAAETKQARNMVSDTSWAHIEGPLRHAGIRTQFTLSERRDADAVVSIRWAHRAASEAKRRGLPEAELHLRELNSLMTTTLIHYVQSGQLDRAKEILPYRAAALGDGSDRNPLDISSEFRLMQRMHPISRSRGGLGFIDKLLEAGIKLKPLKLASFDLFFSTELVAELERRKLLAGAEHDARRDILSQLVNMEQVIKLGDRFHDLGVHYIDMRRADLLTAARILFTKEPPTERDAEAFIYLRQSAKQRTPAALAIAENELMAMGFFDAPAWTADRLRRLSAGSPDDFSLTRAFNTKAAHKEMSETTLPKLLTPKKFALVLEAMGPFGWKPNAMDTRRILDYLHEQTARGMTDEAQAALKTLVAAQADFSLADPNSYLGKREPGLARALLDAGVVKPEHFDLEKVYARTGEFSIRAANAKNAYPEFLCQLILELVDPDRYIPLRLADDRAYQRLFISEWHLNIEPKVRARINSRQPPPRNRGTSSTGPR
jgi:hypothetical protein